MWKFIDSNFFQTLVIFLVGLFIFVMYRINQREDLKRAAIILMMEIREIENSISKLIEQRKTNSFYFTTPIINENSWEKYKFLFIKIFDQDEYSLVNNFYDLAQRIEKERNIIVRQITLGFETKCVSLHQNTSILAKEMRNNNMNEFGIECIKLTEKIYSDTPGFEAFMPKELISILLEQFKAVTASTASSKLKKISKIN